MQSKSGRDLPQPADFFGSGSLINEGIPRPQRTCALRIPPRLFRYSAADTGFMARDKPRSGGGLYIFQGQVCRRGGC